MKLMIGLVPVFIGAAFLEGFITRYSKMPKPLSISILVLSLLFITWYFIAWPIMLQKRMQRQGGAVQNHDQ
jgi:hypothetical protein